ncbi:16S rRNA (guanine(527)-N(7))-methyltransferase RsmG [Pseudoalteromonas sp. NBT06-2]|uniref:16S rRNA (guanine(527)-N(7))-methyltransferase RsmG n=1 Tax=Pseudoalteromonas sp. NBT06-2 TaxID=2025950 RepID=UPI000BA5CC9C|nr:16S rRNA (guanine(527)-N(7))-methyltransferase RsmG [Pseudoalteromonas sp. NBT06-2]PAJ75913.1 16S rRNA (guanine(527)-N(7))-methyltransferase RsmG [Pseudoalteromonas sp. NBT06-2]
MLLEQLNKLLAQTSIKLTDEQKLKLVKYVELLDKWNKAYNLTSVREQSQMMVKHILDALVVAPHINGKNYIDVGTGPGLPGIVLAIALPDTQFILLDSLGKRVRFLTQVKHELGLTNVTPVQSRVEDFQAPVKLDGVLSRAFASIQDMVQWCEHLIDDSGKFIALKGQYPEEELASLPENIKFVENIILEVPGLDAQRHLIILNKAQ